MFDCRPAVLPVFVNVSGIDMRTVRPAKPRCFAPEREQQFGGAALFDYFDPELDVIPQLDSGTDCQDELSAPYGSPMVMNPIDALLPSQVEEDVDLAQILAEFGTLVNLSYEKGAMPPPRNINRRKSILMFL